MGGGRGHGRGSRWRQRRRDREVHGESELVPGARKAPGAASVGWAPCVAGSPRHLQIKHKGEPLQVFGVLWLEGVGPSQVLGSRGEVAELDVGFGS